MLTRCRSDHSACACSTVPLSVPHILHTVGWLPVWRRVRCVRWSGNINSIWSHDDKLNVLVNGRINWTICYCQHCPHHPHLWGKLSTFKLLPPLSFTRCEGSLVLVCITQTEDRLCSCAPIIAVYSGVSIDSITQCWCPSLLVLVVWPVLTKHTSHHFTSEFIFHPPASSWKTTWNLIPK